MALAASIAEAQEEKAHEKTKHHQEVSEVWSFEVHALSFADVQIPVC